MKTTIMTMKNTVGAMRTAVLWLQRGTLLGVAAACLWGCGGECVVERHVYQGAGYAQVGRQSDFDVYKYCIPAQRAAYRF